MLRLFVYNISYVMDNVQFFIFLQVILLSVPLSLQQQDSIPLSWTWSQWAEQISHHRIIRLTELIVRDVTYKLRHAEKLQEQHKHSITFELGSIAAGILDHFKVMLGVYRYYSDGIAFMKKYYDTLQYMDCFHRIQAEYHEIRMEQGMFYDIVRDYEATLGGTTKFTLPPGFTLPPRGARRFVTNPMNASIAGQPGLKSTTKRVETRKRSKKPKWKPAL